MVVTRQEYFFRSIGRQDGYEALESASLKEDEQQKSESTETQKKIKNGFADVFIQFQPYESQNNVSFG